MKKLLILLLLALPISTYCQDIVRSGNVFKVVSKSDTIAVINSRMFYEDKTGKYPIYIGKTGACFIFKTSKKGNIYKKYLGEDISREICKELNTEYKSRR